MSALAPIPGADPATLGVSPSLLAHLEWRLRQSVTTMLTGDYRSVFRGRGMEFDQVVKYAWGDDLRDIDWNVIRKLGLLNQEMDPGTKYYGVPYPGIFLLDARGVISVTERQSYILRVRTLARGCAQAYFDARAALGFPLAEESIRKEVLGELRERAA